ncbi:Probable prolyl 4-hydroxylase 12 [Linum perenne]
MDPSRVVSLSWRPRVFLHEGFLTDEECDHLISMAQAPKDGIVGGGESISAAKKRMLASEKLLSDTDDTIVSKIEERISAWTLLPYGNSRPLQIMHYEAEDPGMRNISYFGNQSVSTFKDPLVATLVLYLSNVTRGGQILFHHSQVSTLTDKGKIWSDCTKSNDILRPEKGKAILLFNLRLDGSPDPRSSHSRCPVQEDGMWVATKLFFVRPVNASDSNSGDECTDEDDNCPSWAAKGECQKNPVYMIGSDDYYGTCRKSCKAC